MKIDISKGWIAYLAFVWGLWTAVICLVIDEIITWNGGYTFFLILHIAANMIVLLPSIVRKKTLEEK